MLLPQVRPDVVVFNWNDTLANHHPALERVFKKAFAEVRDPDVRAALDQMLDESAGIRISYNRFQELTLSVMRAYPRLERQINAFATKYGDYEPPTVLYPGALGFARVLYDARIPAYIVSNSDEDYIHRTLRANGADQLFRDVIVFSKDVAFGTILEERRMDLERAPVAWFIGARPVDFPGMEATDKATDRDSVYRIAVSPRSLAFQDHPEPPGRRFVMEGGYPQIRAHLSSLLAGINPDYDMHLYV